MEARPWPRAGDIVLCASTGASALSAAIRTATQCPYTHAQLVLGSTITTDGPRIQVLEVGLRIRAMDLDPDRDGFVVVRPRIGGYVVTKFEGRRVARDTVRLLEETAGALYPFWKLPLYLLRRDWRGRLLRAGPRQVCSVMTIRSWIGHGLPFFLPAPHEQLSLSGGARVDTPDELESVTPADIVWNARAQGWQVVHRTADAPPLEVAA